MDSAALARLARAADAVAPIVDLFDADPDRSSSFSLDAVGIHADFSRQRIDRGLLDDLVSAATDAGIPARFAAMFAGERINSTEDRQVLHVASRSTDSSAPGAEFAAGQLANAAAAADHIRSDGSITAVVNIGIGGSDLGPAMVVRALRRFCDGPQVRFVSNIDPADLDAALDGLDPARTLVVVSSKTFTTLETMHNAERAREWVRSSGADWTSRFVAATANPDAARAWGIDPNHVLEFGDWVGGRFSVSSVIGFPVMCAIGPARFREFLAGMNEMDTVARTAPLAANLPVVHGLVWWLNAVVRALPTVAVVPYAHDLARLPAFLQQLVMESNGKSVTADGSPVTGPTSPVVWGEPGTNGQHAFFQMLHQGTQTVPVEFVSTLEPMGSDPVAHDLLFANMVAQAEALAVGSQPGDPQRTFPGNRPSTTLVLDRLDPRTLGALVAMYEHSTAVQGWMSGLNSFDQFGVELGKTLATISAEAIANGRPDPSQRTVRGLLDRFIARRSARPR